MPEPRSLTVPCPSRDLPYSHPSSQTHPSAPRPLPVPLLPVLPFEHTAQLSRALRRVRTRGGSRYRPRVRFSIPGMEDPDTSGTARAHSPDLPAVEQPAVALDAVPEEPQGFQRYQTRLRPQAPSLVPQRRCRRAWPSKRAWTSGPGESSTSCPEPSPAPVEESASPHLSPASRIRRPLFTGTPIQGNVDFPARDFHRESFYDVPALTADPRFRDSMRLITQYSLLPFMTPRQFYYPWVVLKFYHSMTSRGVPSPLELRFTIDDRPGVLRAADISAALRLPAELANSGGYRDWPQPS